MDKVLQFAHAMGAPIFFIFLVATAYITAKFGDLTGLYRKPAPWKAGALSTIAFFLGAIAMFIAK